MEKELNTIWTAALAEIQTEISSAQFLTLFKNTSLISVSNETITIGAPSAIVIDMLKKRYINTIKKSLEKYFKKPITILFLPKIGEPKTDFIKNGPLFSDTSIPIKKSIGHPPRVRTEYTFDNMAVSSSNQLAFVSAQAVAKNPGRSYNPLFLYGPVGVGKTHLLHAIANECFEKHPEKQIIYISSEEFTNEVVDAIRSNDTARMKRRFRSAFLLMIDDIQFIEGKERVQEELFHTFNILVDHGSQICLTSDRPPHEIKKIEKRLSSRFAGGLTVDIESPDFELKTAILLIKAGKYNLDLGIDVAKIIAERAEDTRSLEGLLLRVISYASTVKQHINQEVCEAALGTYTEKRVTRIHSDDIIEAVCNYFQLKPTLIKGPKRDAPLVKARQVVMFLLKNDLRLTYVEIGNVLGGRDHTTIMHGVEKMEKLSTANTHLVSDLMGIRKILHG